MHATLLLGAVEVGNYINGWKVLPVVIILAFWARLLTWIDKDADDAHLPRMPLNTGFIVGFIGAFFAFLFLPNFWVALSVLLFFLIVEVAVYLIIRNQKVGLKDLGGKISGIFKSGKEKTVVVAAGEVGIV